MPMNVEPLFLDYGTWRAKNEDLAEDGPGAVHGECSAR